MPEGWAPQDSLTFCEASLFPPHPSLTPELGSRQPKPRGQGVTQTLPVFLASVTGVHGLREGAWREEEAGAGDQLPGSELAGATSGS